MAAMFESFVSAVVLLATIYVVLGLAFAFAFAFRGVNAVDPAAREAGLGFRVLIIPGSVAFWPFLLRRWVEVAR